VTRSADTQAPGVRHAPRSNEALYYDAYWDEDGFRPTGHGFPELAAFVDAHPERTRWLDVGCGDGLTAGPLLEERARTYVGVDVSLTAVEQACANGLDARHIEDAQQLPFPDSTFDAALVIEVFEHLFEPQKTAAEVLRVLEPGGLLFATVPNCAYWRRRAELLLIGRFDPNGDDRSIAEPWRDPHIRFFTPRTLGRMLRDCGFDAVTADGYAGACLADVPKIGARLDGRSSRAYRRLERAMPNLLGRRVVATASRPTLFVGSTTHSA
jgi:2-polyprenyl-6-hydroxyphenyl methylase/3-demethylubiquinone-9 3-methyltransferase